MGGSQGSLDEIVDVALQRLRPGGRLVVNAITLDNTTEAYQLFKQRNLVPDVTLLQISRSQPLGRGPEAGGRRYLRVMSAVARARAHARCLARLRL